jgi:hypothetical protein
MSFGPILVTLCDLNLIKLKLKTESSLNDPNSQEIPTLSYKSLIEKESQNQNLTKPRNKVSSENRTGV